MRVLVAGCGYIGRALLTRLRAAGDEAVGIRRSPPPGSDDLVALDLADADAIARWCEAAPPFDAVVSCVAASRGDEAAYRAAYLDTLAALQHALRATHPTPPALLFTSSTSVYAQDAGEEVDEDSETAPASFRGAVQLEAEARVAAWEGAHLSLRLGGIYGPGRTRLAATVRDVGARGGAAYTNRIHRDDAAGALAHLLAAHDDGTALPPTLVGVDDEPAPRSDVVAWLARALGVPPPRPDGDAVGGKRCRNTRLRATGYDFRYPSYREGYTAVLRDDPAFPSFSVP